MAHILKQPKTGLMDKKELADILDRYVNGTATEQERAWVEDWYNAYHLKATQPLTHAEIEQITNDIESRLPQAEEPAYRKWLRIAALIVGALIALTVFYYMYASRQHKVITGKDVFKAAQNIAPGGNKAVITLADGRRISLTDAANGTLATQNGQSLTKTADGQLVYSPQNTEGKGEGGLNTISTPRGGQYIVTLPDGTKVWINAATTLSYATNLQAQAQRVVTLNGEAYFEVAHNAAKPFIVKTATQSVRVLGTRFNVTAYADNPATLTTLLAGKVSVAPVKGEAAILSPGQQATLIRNSLNVAEADTLLAVAWKNGLIKFRNAELPAIMQQISRWYNVDVAYEGNISKRRFTGGINRNSNLAAVLQILAANDVDFEMRQMPNGTTALLVKEK